MAQENRRNFAEARITELESTENLSEGPDEFHGILSRISKHSRQIASLRVSDWVNDVITEPPQTVNTEFSRVAESSTLPVALTTLTEIVQSGSPNQFAALTSELINFPSAQQLNVAAVNFHKPLMANSSA